TLLGEAKINDGAQLLTLLQQPKLQNSAQLINLCQAAKLTNGTELNTLLENGNIENGQVLLELLQLQDTENSGQLIRLASQLPNPPNRQLILFNSTGASLDMKPFNCQLNQEYGNWHFHFTKDQEVRDVVDKFFVTLENYKTTSGIKQEKHIWFDSPSSEPELSQSLKKLSSAEQDGICKWAKDQLSQWFSQQELQTLTPAQYQKKKLESQIREEKTKALEAQQAATAQAKLLQQQHQGQPLEQYVTNHKIQHAPRYVNAMKKRCQSAKDLAGKLSITEQQAEDILKLPEMT
ncbi:MAG: hypothetical protein WBV73_25175, partial [Phormidium sp.]